MLYVKKENVNSYDVDIDLILKIFYNVLLLYYKHMYKKFNSISFSLEAM